MFSLNSVTIVITVKRLKMSPSHLLCKRPGCYHSTSETHVRDRIFKLSPIHASVIYQIPRIHFSFQLFVLTFDVSWSLSCWGTKVSLSYPNFQTPFENNCPMKLPGVALRNQKYRYKLSEIILFSSLTLNLTAKSGIFFARGTGSSYTPTLLEIVYKTL